ncbi:MAG: Glycyl-tRNA synthetase [uncultured Chthoniobacterales bacterium]|uniref:Glycine--tRNA ligase n=1 Tax=uncultured Chthoniobacterales bacterium TaxID=1836801 RepID=A0A6J4H863_9BACT|nr:MAG: Glycyl-tRNA synthetase [uncultured Chthoniobacterales bacterium]
MSTPNDPQRMERIVSLCKRRGFIFQSSEIYGGLNGVWDFGPLGTELKRNLKDYWWRMMVRERDDVVGLDGSIITHRAVLKASGHEDTFSDPMVDCRTCKARLRADQLAEKNGAKQCSNCGGKDLTEPRAFNLMLRTHLGATEDESSIAYLRPETAQSIFVQFKNVLDTARKKLPFGIAQIGKAFRNEINPRNFIFRSREFEQMELEYFCAPEQGMQLLDYWLEERLKFYENIGIPRAKLHVLTVPDADRAFYSKGTYDIEYEFPFGVQELEGVAYRTNFDLMAHQTGSGKPLEYFDEETKAKFVPHVVEPSAGVDRTLLALICEAYDEETVTDEKGKSEVRTVMRFHPRMAPIKVGVFPLLKNKPELVAKAREVHSLLKPHMMTFYDEGGAIGRRYRRQDEAGTPFGLTIDFETLGERGDELRNTVTLRHRDSMQQERVKIAELLSRLLPLVQ